MILNNLPVPASSSTGNDDGWIDYTEEYNKLNFNDRTEYYFYRIDNYDGNDVMSIFAKIKYPLTESFMGNYFYFPEGYESKNTSQTPSGICVYTSANSTVLSMNISSGQNKVNCGLNKIKPGSVFTVSFYCTQI